VGFLQSKSGGVVVVVSVVVVTVQVVVVHVVVVAVDVVNVVVMHARLSCKQHHCFFGQ